MNMEPGEDNGKPSLQDGTESEGCIGIVETLTCVAKGLDHVVIVWPAPVNYYLECISP